MSYPPSLTGMRGAHDGSWETMHARVAGQQWAAGPVEEEYDLVVVGGGLSGLASAWFYREKHPDARILILDNHDDVGGHAKRNEFEVAGDTRIGYGGTEAIDGPSTYSPEGLRLLQAIGVDLQAFYQAYDDSAYRSLNLGRGIQFDAANFGKDRLAPGYGVLPWQEFAERTPLNERAKAGLVHLHTHSKDLLPGLGNTEKVQYLENISYEQFLLDLVKVDPQILELYRRWTISYWCVGIEEVRALHACKDYGLPGLHATLPDSEEDKKEPYIFHFPDGNAGVVRLLVRSLIPAALPGTTMQDSVTARFQYPALDQQDQKICIRLNSTVVNAGHSADERWVNLDYVRSGKAHTVRARHCVLACYNAAIPYICPELPSPQKAGLAYSVKTPMAYVKVAVPHWRWFADLGLDYVYYTNDFYKQVELDFPISLGSYSRSATPDQPMILHMCHVPYLADIRGPEQWREGRRQMLATPFSRFEERVKGQLDQALGSAGFDADRDITAITVNRWPHGYAYDPSLMWEPDYASEADKPWVIGRQPFGRIHIANSDAGASALTQSAFEQAWRAIAEI